VVTEDRAALVALLREWTIAAEAMTAGRPAGRGAVGGVPEPRRTTPVRPSACRRHG
jgi:deferrochelatase/peroxidase EfeB